MAITNVQRYDIGELRKPEVDPKTGWVRAEGFLARSGILEYKRTDGSTCLEYRPPEEAFSPEAMNSFAFVPLTNGHPPQGFLDASNTKMYQVGSVLQPSQDGDKVRSQFLITDGDAIADAKAGKLQLSGGYTCDLDMTPGEVDGKHYDGVQRNVRGNHVALVKEGRAGPEVRIRLDDNNAIVVVSSQVDESKKFGKDLKMRKLNIDGVEYEVSETAGQAFDKAFAASTATVAKLQASLEQEKARADAAESDAKKSKAELATAPEKIRAEISARVALEAKAHEVLPEAKFDGKTDTEVKRAVAEHVLNLKLDGKGEIYVDASFELALKQFEGNNPGILAATKQDIAPIENVRSTDSVSEAQKKFAEASRNAYLGKK